MYGILLKFGWRRQIQYRAGMALRLVGDMLRLYIKGCIWLALLKDGFSETAAYTLISLLILILTDTRISGELADRVKSGMIAVDLIRPISLKWYFFFDQLGENVLRFLAEGLVLIPFAFCLWNLPLPSVSSMCFGSLAVVFAVILATASSIPPTSGVLDEGRNLYPDDYRQPVYAVFRPVHSFVVLSSVAGEVLWLSSFRLTVYEPVCIWLGRYTHAECIRLLILSLSGFWR
ncbi:MAG: hypothetical protein ACLVG5_11410 [Clostridium sp.]